MNVHSMMARATDTSLANLGFRRWYERRLIVSHLWLVLCFLSIVAVATCFELTAERKSPGDFLLNATLLIAAAVIAWQSWQRYAGSMAEAQSIGVQAVCKACKHYGFRFNASDDGRWVAMCPRCKNHWDIEH